jgi:NADP-dependent aldehyde dehydrogenase
MLNAGIDANYRGRREALARQPDVAEVASGPGRQAALFRTTAAAFLENPALHEEVFGPATLLITCTDESEMLACAAALEGQLTATVHAEQEEHERLRVLLEVLRDKAGRLVYNGYPTGVDVCQAMVHGGPWPATSDGRTTSVGQPAINRWCRAVCYQNYPSALLPPELQDSNPLGIWRLVDGKLAR